MDSSFLNTGRNGERGIGLGSGRGSGRNPIRGDDTGRGGSRSARGDGRGARGDSRGARGARGGAGWAGRGGNGGNGGARGGAQVASSQPGRVTPRSSGSPFLSQPSLPTADNPVTPAPTERALIRRGDRDVSRTNLSARNDGVSYSVASGGAVTDTSTADSLNCLTCSQPVGDDTIGCDRCENWFCPTSMCMGIKESAIQAIHEDGGTAILFICTDCRFKAAALTPKGPGQEQLLTSFKSLCSLVQNLNSNVDSLKTSVTQLQAMVGSSQASPAQSGTGAALLALPPPPPADGTASGAPIPPPQETLSTAVRVVVREEMREERERQKRVRSVMVFGISAGSDDEFSTIFKQVARSLLGCYVDFNGIVCINRGSNIYRLNIGDLDTRKNLLEKAKTLKDHANFSHVNIRRDLTIAQRQELKRRGRSNMQAAQQTPSGGDMGPPSLDPSGGARRKTVLGPDVTRSISDSANGGGVPASSPSSPPSPSGNQVPGTRPTELDDVAGRVTQQLDAVAGVVPELESIAGALSSLAPASAATLNE